MKLKIISLKSFKKDVKKLHKKYKNIANDLKMLEALLLKNPKSGIKLSNNCYKIRLPNSSIPTGRRGGFRIIYYFLNGKNSVYLMTIYSKTDLENISDEKIDEILKKYL